MQQLMRTDVVWRVVSPFVVALGSIPDDLALLSRLERLDLRDNCIMGEHGLPA
jgi:hypothetical protein